VTWTRLGEAWIVSGLRPGVAGGVAKDPPPGVAEAWACGESVGIVLREGVSPASVVFPAAPPAAVREHVITVTYDGPDLSEVANLVGLSADEVVARHLGGEYTCAVVGFCPGFGYLDGLDERLQVPRLSSPRSLVPAGSVAIAGVRTAIYPLARPGGWRIIGRTDLPMVDVGVGFCRLHPGDRVRFVRAD